MQVNRRYHRQTYSNAYVAVALMAGQQNHTLLGGTDLEGRRKYLRTRISVYEYVGGYQNAYGILV